MAAARFPLPNVAHSVFALSKTVWRLGICLANLGEQVYNKDLTDEVKSLGNVCDLAYTTLDGMSGKSGYASFLPAELEDQIWSCLATQVDEASHTMQELDLFIKTVQEKENSNFVDQAQRWRSLYKSENEMVNTQTRIGRHARGLQITTHLIKIAHQYIAPGRAPWQLLEDMNMLQNLVTSLRACEPQWSPSHNEALLLRCSHDAIAAGTAAYEVSLASRSREWQPPPAHQPSSITDANDWMRTLEAIQQGPSAPSGPHSNMTSAQHTSSSTDSQRSSADDLVVDLAKAALETGTKAFEAQAWEEADSLLREALDVLAQLTPQQRLFCDVFSLQYRLALCTYHTQDPKAAEAAFLNLVEQTAATDQEREYVLTASHLLAVVHTRNGDIDRARSECETALQGRRKMLGKHHDASLESLALMAHIYVLLGKRALAKSCLAMISEKRRDAVLETVEASLGPAVEHLDFASLLTPQLHEESPRSDVDSQRILSKVSGSTVGLGMEKAIFDYGSTTTNSPAASPQPPPLALTSRQPSGKDMPTHEVWSASPHTALAQRDQPQEQQISGHVREAAQRPSQGVAQQASHFHKTDVASRKAILERIGCQPRDRFEEAVCASDHIALANLLTKKKGFWRSGLRKRGRPERVTALHFAALFGELDMARRLIDAGYNVNEIPFGYSTSLTPLNFGIGARQADMVEFLIKHGARPAESESWSTLAGSLLSRSWLVKTMFNAEKDFVANRITATMTVLLRHGWNVNEPVDKSGKTVLHQAISFWTGEFRWDLDLRTGVTTFLCERGANPFQANTEGKTPHDVASASGHQDLLAILGRSAQRRGLSDGGMEPVELPAHVL
ncbi:hypothetical protein EK21DRAFT_57831 [Setomelanomma holmii]|uniref:Uncharacterized protein n=1 Tax=Setomelanomma holmii TaxID=210430 RepID=A0A9P4HIY1_9PLEO|nr:hypothetical protein EK21DRAFT_57831 [Setomelanomma holmii]